MTTQNLDFLLDDGHNPGYVPDRIDPRDYQYRDAMAMGAVSAVPFDWDIGHDTEKNLGVQLTRKAQNGSSSCVGQTFSEYQEGLNFIETKGTTVFSAKGLYAQIYLPQGGAYTRDCADLCVGKGGYLEADVVSYENGNPPTEEFMRRGQDIAEQAHKNAQPFGQKNYFYVDLSIEMVAQAIRDNGFVALAFRGTNQGWRYADVIPPVAGDTQWGHQVLGKAAGMRNGKRAIKFQNSWGSNWGENGDGWINEDYFAQTQFINTPLVLVDKKNFENLNPIDMNSLKLVKMPGSSSVYIVSKTGYYYPIAYERFIKEIYGEWSNVIVETIPAIPSDKVRQPVGLYLN